jgi:Asp-tRNA(Asn)/Glu-tRNA(Gln) amidotransferase C subunit
MKVKTKRIEAEEDTGNMITQLHDIIKFCERRDKMIRQAPKTKATVPLVKVPKKERKP